MSVEVPINVRCTWCNKELSAVSKDGVKVVKEKCTCSESKDYFDSKVVDKPRVYKKPKEEKIDG